MLLWWVLFCLLIKFRIKQFESSEVLNRIELTVCMKLGVLMFVCFFLHFQYSCQLDPGNAFHILYVQKNNALTMLSAGLNLSPFSTRVIYALRLSGRKRWENSECFWKSFVCFAVAVLLCAGF